MEVHVYHAVSQSHMAEAVAYVLRDKLLVQGAFSMLAGKSTGGRTPNIDNIKHWNLQVDTDASGSRRVLPLCRKSSRYPANDKSGAGTLRSDEDGRSIYAGLSGHKLSIDVRCQRAGLSCSASAMSSRTAPRIRDDGDNCRPLII